MALHDRHLSVWTPYHAAMQGPLVLLHINNYSAQDFCSGNQVEFA